MSIGSGFHRTSRGLFSATKSSLRPNLSAAGAPQILRSEVTKKAWYHVNATNMQVSRSLMRQTCDKSLLAKGPRLLPKARSSVSYSVMEYLLSEKKNARFDPVLFLSHFVEAGPENSDTRAVNVEKRSDEQRIRSRIAYFTESLRQKEGSFFSQANNTGLGEKKKRRVFPFSGATLFLSREGLGVSKPRQEAIDKQRAIKKKTLLLVKTKIKSDLGAKNSLGKCISKFIEEEKMGELMKYIETIIEMNLGKQTIPYAYNSYLSCVRKMELSTRRNTTVKIEACKIQSIYQSANLIAEEVAFLLKTKRMSFPMIYSQIVENIPKRMSKVITGMRISVSGRANGAEMARTECAKYGKTSGNVFSQKLDYAATHISTRYGIVGIKVWVSYGQKEQKKDEK